MTPSGLIFTSLSVNKDKPGHENDNSFTVAKRLIEKNGIQGMFGEFLGNLVPFMFSLYRIRSEK